MLDVGGDRYLLLQHPGGPITIRLSDDRPAIRTVSATLLKGLDLCLIVYPGADRTACAAAVVVGILGLGWLGLRRRARFTAFFGAAAVGAIAAGLHVAYALARVDRIDAVSRTALLESWPLDTWMFAGTASLAAWAFLRFALARGWPGKWLALAIGGLLSGWGPVIVWLGWPLVFNRMVAARIGSPLYNNHAGLLTLAGAIAFTLSLAAIFNLIERMPRSVPTAGEPSRSVSR